MIIELEGLAPAAEEGWDTLFDLNEVDSSSWLLVGGQMMHLLSVEHDAAVVRPTVDVDVVVDVRTRPQGTRWLAAWLQDRGFTFEGASPDGIGHRFLRPASGGPGKVIVDVLAAEGVGAGASLITVPPNRTVQVPGTVQALRRSRLVTVGISGLVGRPPRVGSVRCPSLLGALVGKAAAARHVLSDGSNDPTVPKSGRRGPGKYSVVVSADQDGCGESRGRPWTAPDVPWMCHGQTDVAEKLVPLPDEAQVEVSADGAEPAGRLPRRDVQEALGPDLLTPRQPSTLRAGSPEPARAS